MKRIREIDIPAKSIAEICQRFHVKELSLFGSALEEGFGPESDFDLLVEFKPQARIGFLSLARMQRELSLVLNRKVDLVPKNGLKPRIRNAVLSKAEVLFDNQLPTSLPMNNQIF